MSIDRPLDNSHLMSLKPSIVHVANTNFEFELGSSSPLEASFAQSWSKHPLCLQLQYLPILAAYPQDLIAVTAAPGADYIKTLEKTGWWPQGLPQFVPLEETSIFIGKKCLSWGSSLQVKEWAEKRQMDYSIPPWEVVKLVNSKAFSFRYQTIQEAALIENETQLVDWLQEVEGTKVLKTCYGLSGKGNWIVHGQSVTMPILKHCRSEWNQRRPIIGEPWVDRVYDFSTQWHIHPGKDIEWIGATRFKTNDRGKYEGTYAGPENLLFDTLEPFLEEHRKFVQKPLEDMAALGYFGFVGCDALIYRNPSNPSLTLYPLVEINARQTMSLMALRLQQRLFPDSVIHLAFHQPDTKLISLLPMECADSKGRIIHCRQKLCPI